MLFFCLVPNLVAWGVNHDRESGTEQTLFIGQVPVYSVHLKTTYLVFKLSDKGFILAQLQTQLVLYEQRRSVVLKYVIHRGLK